MHRSTIATNDFVDAWGKQCLVGLPRNLATAVLPHDACEFLVQAGLPALITYNFGCTESKITFCRLEAGMCPILSEKYVGPRLPDDWSAYWVLGDEFFCNGAAWWCIHRGTGQIYRIDIELSFPIELANTSVGHFASALLAASSWSELSSRSSDKWQSEVSRIKQQLLEIDPASMRSDRNFWPAYLKFIENEGPQVGDFRKGSRSEGQLALEVGSW